MFRSTPVYTCLPFSLFPLPSPSQPFVYTVSSIQVYSTAYTFVPHSLLLKTHTKQLDKASKMHTKERRLIQLPPPPTSPDSGLNHPPSRAAILQACRMQIQNMSLNIPRRATAATGDVNPEPSSILKTPQTAKLPKISKGIFSKRRRKGQRRVRFLRHRMGSKSPPVLESVLETKSETEAELKIEFEAKTEPEQEVPVRKMSIVHRVSLKLSLSQRRRKIQEQLHNRRSRQRKKTSSPATYPPAPQPKAEQENSATKRRDRRERMKRGRKQSDRGKQQYHTRVRNPNWKSGVQRH